MPALEACMNRFSAHDLTDEEVSGTNIFIQANEIYS